MSKRLHWDEDIQNLGKFVFECKNGNEMNGYNILQSVYNFVTGYYLDLIYDETFFRIELNKTKSFVISFRTTLGIRSVAHKSADALQSEERAGGETLALSPRFIIWLTV